jgi:hypothetical protein
LVLFGSYNPRQDKTFFATWRPTVMRRFVTSLAIAGFILLIAIGCAGGNAPLVPGGNQNLTATASQSAGNQMQLWGLYDVYIDIPTQTATAVLNRTAMFSANVVTFLNGKVANLGFLINETPVKPEYVDVDIDVSMTHPFPGLSQYNGYDVRGIFMGNGNGVMAYNSKLKFPKKGTDQILFDDPEVAGSDAPGGGPDGFTRWFNMPEFLTPGVLGYTAGKVASAGYSPTATLCPYKYFADGLGKNDIATTWMNTHASTHGVFTAGTTNTRNYYLRFPNSVGVKFAYAVVASWKGEAPEDHPANCPESVAASVTVTPDIYFASGTDKGGSLKFDVDLYGWGVQPSSIKVESTVLTANYSFTGSAIGGGENFSTYHIEVPADKIMSTGGNDFWVVPEYAGFNYKNDFGVTNSAGNDALASFFHYDLYVSPVAYNKLPVCDLDITSPTMPASGIGGVPVSFDASGSSDPDPGDTITFTWDFNGNGVYSESPADDYTGTPDMPTHFFAGSYTGSAYVKVTDSKGAESICSVPIDVTAKTGKNIVLRTDPAGITAWDIACDDTTGDLYIIYSDATIWKYTRAGSYEDGAQWAGSSFPAIGNWWNWRLDLNPGGQVVASAWSDGNGGYGYIGYYGRCSFSPTGTLYFNQNYTTVGPNTEFWDVPEVCAFQADPFLDNNGMVYTKRDNATQVSITIERGTPGAAPTPYGDGALNRHRLYVPDPMPVNPAYIGWKDIKGTEPGRTDTTVWFLQGKNSDNSAGGQYYASRFLITGSGFPGPFAYDFSSIGTGGQVDADTGFWDPQDITRNNGDSIHVLDINSAGIPTIKVFDDSNPTVNPTSVGHYGNATSIDKPPLRIEGSQYDDWIYVLAGVKPKVASIGFTGGGLNNLVTSASYTGTANHTYTVEVDSVGAQDTIRWRRDSDPWSATGVPMLTYSMSLTDSVGISFLATTGHTLGNYWTITCTAGEASRLSVFLPSEMP